MQSGRSRVFLNLFFIRLPLVLGVLHEGSISCSVQTLWLWLIGLVAPRHMGYEFPDQD